MVPETGQMVINTREHSRVEFVTAIIKKLDEENIHAKERNEFIYSEKEI